MGGDATFSGTSYQAGVIAHVLVHLLSRRRLRWLDPVDDTPIAVSGEVGGPGDDARIELGGHHPAIELQAKHGLTAGAELRTVLHRIGHFSNDPNGSKLVVIAVNRGSSRFLYDELPVDLERVRSRRMDAIRPGTRELLQHFGADIPTWLQRVRIVPIDVDTAYDMETKLSLQWLAEILEEPGHAESAWAPLRQEATYICSRRLRRDRDGLIATLEGAGIRLLATGTESLCDSAIRFAAVQRRRHEAERLPYVERTDSETTLARILGVHDWIDVEGESGTGKSTLLRHFHDQLAVVCVSNAKAPVPLLMQTEWLLDKEPLMTSPLAALTERWRTPLPPVWSVPLVLADALRHSGRQLVTFVDTLDGALIGSMSSRVRQWVLGELRHDNLRLITACRPLEADAFLPRNRVKVAVGDFEEPEARHAIRRYSTYFYSGLGHSVEVETARRLESYLRNPRFADLYRRPVTLRMLFEAYPDGPPSEAVDRNRLFADYWNTKVRGRRIIRPTRADAERRAQFVLALAGSMVEERVTSVSVRDLQRAGLRTFDEPLEDLRSEGVIETHGNDADSVLTFFHQSFLEYAGGAQRRRSVGRPSPTPAAPVAPPHAAPAPRPRRTCAP
jgi:hypothetical protein